MKGLMKDFAKQTFSSKMKDPSVLSILFSFAWKKAQKSEGYINIASWSSYSARNNILNPGGPCD